MQRTEWHWERNTPKIMCKLFSISEFCDCTEGRGQAECRAQRWFTTGVSTEKFLSFKTCAHTHTHAHTQICVFCTDVRNIPTWGSFVGRNGKRTQCIPVLKEFELTAVWTAVVNKNPKTSPLPFCKSRRNASSSETSLTVCLKKQALCVRESEELYIFSN